MMELCRSYETCRVGRVLDKISFGTQLIHLDFLFWVKLCL
jgi:hypothetical protein